MSVNNLRKHGTDPFKIVLVHGGPGASGELYPVAKKLSKLIGVLEPLQTKNSINGQIEELRKIIEKNGCEPVILVGWSWGAWLSYMFTAKYPKLVRKLVLVSSGPFETNYIEQIMKTRLKHLKGKDKLRAEELLNRINNNNLVNNKIFKEFGELMEKADSYYSIETNNRNIILDNDIYLKVWGEASKLRESGKLLELGKKIYHPVVIIHGAYDPHPINGVVNPLKKVIKDVKIYKLKKCGHSPWKEKFARDEFFNILKKELLDSIALS